jgi:DivIVA domain-containing protein
MDRNSIQRRDFPVGRRGYDPAAVDAHLRAVADEMEQLRERAAEPAARGLSAGTSEQVRVILEAAERSAGQLRDQAGREAGEHVGRVQDATGAMLEQLGSLQGELDGMLDALKRSGELLEQGLAQLRADVGMEQPAAAPAAPPEPPEPEPVPEPPVVTPAPESDAPAVNGRPDEAGARLIALNMALTGTPREETERYLAEHYDLADAGALLDDVYRRAGS